MRRAPILLLLPLLAACGTPQERCIRSATSEIRTIDRLIVETEGNLARGYALEPTTVYRTVWVPCAGAWGGLEPALVRPAGMCLDERPEITTRPKAIDLAAERRTLDGLRQKRAELSGTAAERVELCRATYPQ
jgi:hypothetical protein